jgi:hypothetical protein
LSILLLPGSTAQVLLKEYLPKENTDHDSLKWGVKMEYMLEEVERDYIEFRKEMGEE